MADADSVAQDIASANNVMCKAYKSDVKSASLIESTIKSIAADFGHLDIVVANAGIATHYPAEDYTEDQWSEIMKVNLDGAFFTAQAASRIFKKQGHGNLIFTASVSAILVNVPQKQAAVRLNLFIPMFSLMICSTTHPKRVWFTWPSV